MQEPSSDDLGCIGSNGVNPRLIAAADQIHHEQIQVANIDNGAPSKTCVIRIGLSGARAA